MNDITTELSDGILRVELNRPEKKNALTAAMYTRLAEILDEADKDDAVRILLLHGAGNSFSAGNDIEDFLKNPPGAGNSPQRRLTEALIAFGKPIVAAVHGAAVGGGTTMLTHFDIVYAGESARFLIPFINLALVPGIRLQLLDPGARRLSSRGGIVPAGRAVHRRSMRRELGLVTRVVPDADLLATARATAVKLAAKPGGALRASKRLLKSAAFGPLRDAVEGEAQEFTARVRSAEAREAFSAFLEKRPPNFAKAA